MHHGMWMSIYSPYFKCKIRRGLKNSLLCCLILQTISYVILIYLLIQVHWFVVVLPFSALYCSCRYIAANQWEVSHIQQKQLYSALQNKMDRAHGNVIFVTSSVFVVLIGWKKVCTCSTESFFTSCTCRFLWVNIHFMQCSFCSVCFSKSIPLL